MNEQLRLLIELQKIDSNILSTKLKIEEIPSRISAFEEPLINAEKSYEKAKQQQAQLEKKKKEKESEIEDISEKIKKLKQRSSEIKTNKEYQAHLKEIEKREKELSSSEDELLSVMESMEESSKTLETEKACLTEERAKIDSIKKELNNEVQKGEEELKRLKEDRKRIADQIDSSIYSEYMTILKTASGLAVAEARSGVCQGCNLHIPPQLFVEIKNNRDIIHCHQCRRILYYSREQSQ